MAHRSFRHQYVTLIGISIACAIAMAAIGHYPTARMTGPEGVRGMFFGVSASLLASLLGAIPVCLVAVRAPDKVPLAILAGTALRFVIILMIVVPVTLSGWVDRVAFVSWVAISYLLLLLADTLATMASVRSRYQVER